jgi:hypothetical protein
MHAIDALVAWQQMPSTVAYVEVRKPDGSVGTGSAFHLGRGYFATARHVLAPAGFVKIGRFNISVKTQLTPGGKFVRTKAFPTFEDAKIAGPFLHPDSRVDSAIFQLVGSANESHGSVLQPRVRLFRQVDVAPEGELLMKEVYVLGYPPIPWASEPSLVVVRGEIAAIVKSRVDGRRHFVISGMARGGFGGGPVFLMGNPGAPASAGSHGGNSGTVVGIIGEAPAGPHDGGTPRLQELGFLTAVSAETLWEIVDHHQLEIPEIKGTASHPRSGLHRSETGFSLGNG